MCENIAKRSSFDYDFQINFNFCIYFVIFTVYCDLADNFSVIAYNLENFIKNSETVRK